MLRLNWLKIDFRNDFPENGGVWLLLQIRSNWKAFPVDRIWEPKQRKWFSVSIFTSNYFRPWKIEERERERERGRKKESIATSPSANITGWHGSADHDRDRDLRFDLRAMRRSSRDRADRNLAFVFPDLMIFFWILFVFWGINDIIYSFGNRENVRKCEQEVENVFSMVFSRTQPNIRKYFLKHFLKCNQTHENIFLSGK